MYRYLCSFIFCVIIKDNKKTLDFLEDKIFARDFNMKAVLKEIFCMAWEFGEEIVLDENKSVSVEFYIGMDNSEEIEQFTITVCNPEFVRRIVEKNSVFCPMWYLITNNPTKENIYNYISGIVSKLEGKDRTDIVSKLRLIGEYEFENYQKFLNDRKEEL